MKRFILAPSAALLVLLALSVGPAAAQISYPYTPPIYRPGYTTNLSPWLNLLRGGDPAANYFIGVEPEMQRRRDRNVIYGNLQGINQQLLPPRPGITDQDLDTPLRSTGHPTGFGYTGTYFGNAGSSIRTPGNPFGGQAGGRSQNAPQPAGKAPPRRR